MVKTGRFRRNEEYICREVAGEAILVPTGEAALQFSGMGAMNPTALFIWNLLEEERDFDELCSLFAAEYELTNGQAKEDVGDFLALAMEHNVILGGNQETNSRG